MQPNQSLPTQETPNEVSQDSGVLSSTESKPELSLTNETPKLSNEIWAKDINIINKNYLKVYSVVLVLVDLPIVLLSMGALMLYLLIMLGAVGIMGLCAWIEYSASKRLEHSARSGSDVLILLLVHLRNMIVLLNVIPGIQLLGMAAAFFGGYFIIILQFLLIGIRISRAHTAAK